MRNSFQNSLETNRVRAREKRTKTKKNRTKLLPMTLKKAFLQNGGSATRREKFIKCKRKLRTLTMNLKLHFGFFVCAIKTSKNLTKSKFDTEKFKLGKSMTVSNMLNITNVFRLDSNIKLLLIKELMIICFGLVSPFCFMTVDLSSTTNQDSSGGKISSENVGE
jgi:hypothetical protein